jgi:hypothetical protein
LSKFVKFAAKRGLLRVKETRQGDLQVLSVNPQHEDCQLLERYRAKHKSQKQKLMTATTVDSSSGVNKQSASAERLIYTALYRLKRSDDWEELVRSTGLQIGNSESLNEREGYYTADEITRVLKAYSDSLADPSDRRWVLPDNRLAAVMGEGKTAGEVGRRYSRRQIQDAVLSNALEHFVLGPISVGEEHLPIQ